MFSSIWFYIAPILICAPYTASHSESWQNTAPAPSEIMVDVVNNLGLNILKIHNVNNENNIALSPYGIASILTALLEGVRGRAAFEIQQCGGFPADKDKIRVGLRDIHRLLRSYFIPQEGFLSGLSLSSEKVILKAEYQSILRFYGFDMTSFNTPIYPDLTTTPLSNLTTLSTESVITDGDISTTTPETTTQISNITTENSTQLTDETSTIKSDITTLNINEETTILQPSETTTNLVTNVPETTISTSVSTTETVTTEITTTVEATQPETELPETTTITLPMETEILVTEAAKITLTTEDTENITTSTEILKELTETTLSITENTESVETTTETIETSTTNRNRRSIVDYIIARYYDERNPSIYAPDLPKSKYSFLVAGKYQEPHVNFMTYETVLSFFYIHNLDSLALRFPLDSPKYYLLLILPVDEQGIDRLICDIGKYATLKEIISHMRPTYVRAIIPSFMLRGFVILTSTLQKIGIRQIFEPRHSDFSLMTEDKEIYVTNIEQAITVTIKNYMDAGVINKNRNFYQYGPVEFKATHPFLYFVMDSEIDVTLVAGKIVNPINSRIQ